MRAIKDSTQGSKPLNIGG